MSGPVFLDFFAGFGGSSSGLVEAGYELSTAYNHWDKAVAVHSANHRAADHVQGDLSGYDMRRLPKNAEVLWASPECTWHSPAGGRARPKRADEVDLFGEAQLGPDAGIRSRATMWDPIRAAEARRFKAVIIENVPEVATWELFRVWLKAWEALGYEWQIINVSAAHVYGPGNAPAGQWRDRIYIVLNQKGVKMPRIQPRPLAWCDQCDAVVESVQSWKKHDPVQVGKYGRQYVYVCGANRHAKHVVEPYVLPAASVIDWSDLGVRIGDREKPLAAATMRRVEMGLRMFARPAVVAGAGQTWDAAVPGHRAYGDPTAYYRAWAADTEPLMTRQAGGSGDALAVPPFLTAVNHDQDDRARTLDAGPLPTRSTKIGDGLVFPPFLVDKYDYQGGDERRVRSSDVPLGTITTSNHGQVVFPPFMSHQYGEMAGSERRNDDIEASPLGAITAGGAHHNLVIPPYVVDYHGTGTANSSETPLAALTAEGNHHGLTFPPDAFLSRQYGSRGQGAALNTSVLEPTHPITASGGNHALVIPSRKRPTEMFEGELPFSLDDVRFRMLGPTEHLRAQRFWEGYDTRAANKSETTKGAGNAVAVNVAHWVGQHVKEALS